MKYVFGRLGVQRIGKSSENGLDLVGLGDWVKALALGLTATLLFSLGLYILISGMLIVFLTFVL